MRVRELIPIFIISLLLMPLVVMGKGGSTLVVPPWNHCLGLHKVGQFHLDIYSGYRRKFNDPQGLFCTKLRCKDDPEAARDDDELNVFGLNSGAHELIYNTSLTSINVVGEEGSGGRQFNRPRSITGDREGNIYVADTGNDRIVRLAYRNDDLASVAVIGGGILDGPSGICLSGGILYVADTGNDRICLFDTSGTLLDVWRPRLGPDRLREPYSIVAVSEGDTWLYYRRYFVAVVDSVGLRLWMLDEHGNADVVMPYADLGRGGRFNHIAVDYYGNVYATDAVENVIHKFDRHLNYIVAVGGGDGSGHRFDEPRGIAIYRRFGQLFVSERAGAQYFWIGTDIIRLTADALTVDTATGRLSVGVSFLLTEHAAVSLRLESERGDRVIPLLEAHLLPCGRIERRFEVPVNDASALAKCTFKLVASAKPTYSSGAFLTVRRETPYFEPTAKTITSSANH